MNKDLDSYQAYAYYSGDHAIKNMQFKGKEKGRIAHLLLDKSAPVDLLLEAANGKNEIAINKLANKILSRLQENPTENMALICQVADRLSQINHLKSCDPKTRAQLSIQQILKITQPKEREMAMRHFLNKGGTLTEIANYVIQNHSTKKFFDGSLHVDFDQACLAIAAGRKILQERNLSERMFSFFAKMTGNDDETQALNLLLSILVKHAEADAALKLTFDDPQLFDLACNLALPGLAHLSLEYRAVGQLAFSDLMQYVSKLNYPPKNFDQILECFEQNGALANASLLNKSSLCHALLNCALGVDTKEPAVKFVVKMIHQNPELQADDELLMKCIKGAIDCRNVGIFQELTGFKKLDFQQTHIKVENQEIPLLTYMLRRRNVECLKWVCEQDPENKALHRACMRTLLEIYADRSTGGDPCHLSMIDYLQINFSVDDIWETEFGPTAQLLQPFLNEAAQMEDEDARKQKLAWILMLFKAVKTGDANSPQLVKVLMPLIGELNAISNPLILNQKLQCLLVILREARNVHMPADEFEKNLATFKAIFNYRKPADRTIIYLALFKLYQEGAEGALEKWQQIREHINQTASTKKEAWLIPALLLIPYLDETMDAAGSPTFKAFFNIKSDMFDGAKLQNLTQLLLVLKDQVSIEKANQWLELSFKDKNKAARMSHWTLLTTICNMGWGEKLESMPTFDACEKLRKDNFSQTFNLQLEDFDRKFNQTIGTFREPTALLTYQANLQKGVGEADYQRFHRLISQFAAGILEGSYPDMRYDLSNEHLKTVFEGRQELLAEWRKGEQLKPEDLVNASALKISDKWLVVDTDHPEEMTLMGNVQNSCQNIRAGASSRCLMNYILDGKNRLIAVKDENGHIIGRCVLRMLWDKQQNRPVLFREKLYINNQNPKVQALVKAMCEKRAKALGLPLLANDDLTPEDEQKVNYGPVHSLANLSDEYVDALGGIMHGPYQIEGAKLICSPQVGIQGTGN